MTKDELLAKADEMIRKAVMVKDSIDNDDMDKVLLRFGQLETLVKEATEARQKFLQTKSIPADAEVRSLT